LFQKVLPIPIAIPYEKSIANSNTNTFSPILFYDIPVLKSVSVVYFMS